MANELAKAATENFKVDVVVKLTTIQAKKILLDHDLSESFEHLLVCAF